ncbi:hypothetical protein AKO1_010650 [Acrasis kona]|uniref:Nodulin-like domain-containing protein n=1 Tax=Acrasis kona TaxID=1008807 RepID=A0AAW2ZKQ8_9EUKA
MRNYVMDPPHCNVWIVLAAAIAMMVLAGTDYVFATLYVPLKEHLYYNQIQIQTVGSMRMLSNLFSLATGVFHDRAGPRLTCSMGLILLVIGYSLFYMTLLRLFVVPYWVLGLFLTTLSWGTNACYTSGLSTCLKNFDPKHRGKIVGSLLCIYGMTGGLFSALFRFVFAGNIVHFVFFMLLFCGSMPIIGIIFLSSKQQDPVNVNDERTGLLTNPNVDPSESTEDNSIIKKQVKDDNPPTYRVIMTQEFWLLSLCTFCSMGSSVCLLNNLGSVVQSYGGEETIVAILMIIYSAASSFGRILLGLLSDRLSQWMSRPAFLNCCYLSIGICMFCFAYSTVPMFYVLIFLFGVSYGGMMSTTPTLIGDLWGTKHFATNVATVFLFQLLGSYLISTVMASNIYESYIRGDGKKCRGRNCFMYTFIICAALSIVSYTTCLVIMRRIKPKIVTKDLKKLEA